VSTELCKVKFRKAHASLPKLCHAMDGRSAASVICHAQRRRCGEARLWARVRPDAHAHRRRGGHSRGHCYGDGVDGVRQGWSGTVAAAGARVRVRAHARARARVNGCDGTRARAQARAWVWACVRVPRVWHRFAPSRFGRAHETDSCCCCAGKRAKLGQICTSSGGADSRARETVHKRLQIPCVPVLDSPRGGDGAKRPIRPCRAPVREHFPILETARRVPCSPPSSVRAPN
jgi:hypothetical protein